MTKCCVFLMPIAYHCNATQMHFAGLVAQVKTAQKCSCKHVFTMMYMHVGSFHLGYKAYPELSISCSGLNYSKHSSCCIMKSLLKCDWPQYQGVTNDHSKAIPLAFLKSFTKPSRSVDFSCRSETNGNKPAAKT